MATLRSFRRTEREMARRPDHLYVVAYVGSLAVMTSLALPYMPNVIPRFFQRTLQVGTWADIALLNLYAATYVITLLAGTIDLLRVWVLPVEEGHLSLYLSKPLTPVQFLRARFTPVLVNAILMAAASQAAVGLSVWHLIGPFSRNQFLWSSGIIIALILFILCALNFCFLFVKESYYGLVVSIVSWTLTLAPVSLYVYRPDLFSRATRALVFPANLLWYPSPILHHTGSILLGLAAGSVLFCGLAVLKLRRAPLG